MALYQLHFSGRCILRHTDGAQIPLDTSNSDYRDYLAWVVAGNTPDPADAAPPPDPQDVADQATFSDLAMAYAAMVTKLEAIVADMATLDGHANTLSTVTITSFAQTQANLRALGADLKTLVDDVSALAADSERVLKVAAVIVRRGGAG